jgi:hypothetical protein
MQLARKLAISLIAKLMLDGFLQSLLVTVSLGGFLIAHIVFSPLKYDLGNRIELIGLLLQLTLGILGTIIMADLPASDPYHFRGDEDIKRAGLFVLIVIVLAIVIDALLFLYFYLKVRLIPNDENTPYSKQELARLKDEGVKLILNCVSRCNATYLKLHGSVKNGSFIPSLVANESEFVIRTRTHIEVFTDSLPTSNSFEGRLRGSNIMLKIKANPHECFITVLDLNIIKKRYVYTVYNAFS